MAIPARTPADLAAVVQLYGLRNWVEQSYKQVKGALGWNAYQVRKDHAIRRHWALVCCAFSFCWWAAVDDRPEDADERGIGVTSSPSLPVSADPTTDLPASAEGKNPAALTPAQPAPRPRMSWPVALRRVRAWLEPWVMLARFWRGWSAQPPPPPLQRLLDWVGQ